MSAYILRAALRGVSPLVWRRFRVPETISLAALHEVIQILYGWDNEYLHCFHIYGINYGVAYDGGLAFRDNAHHVVLESFGFDVSDKFTYEYNFFENHVVEIRVEKIIEEKENNKAIKCINGNGMPGADKYSEVEPMLKFLEALAKADERTTMGDLRPYVDELNAVRFNRLHLNHQLQTEITI